MTLLPDDTALPRLSDKSQYLHSNHCEGPSTLTRTLEGTATILRGLRFSSSIDSRSQQSEKFGFLHAGVNQLSDVGIAEHNHFQIQFVCPYYIQFDVKDVF
ncbi:hypothetical protein JTB14_000479 [Gonioctena quinquepunctata]|nr:hypothetical protein JTB14_000479 [Gonioctena quinquepunctata]